MSARRPTAPRAGRADGEGAPGRARPASRPSGEAAGRPTPRKARPATGSAPATARPTTAGSAPRRARPTPSGSASRKARPTTSGSTPGKAHAPATAPPSTSRRAVAFGRGDGTPAPAVSLRMLGIFLVALVAFVVLAPTLRYAVAQQEQLRTLNADVADARARNTELQRQFELWQDPLYVQAQARDRLGYVMPGETPYIVVDPETITGGESVADVEAAERAAARAAATPWYLRVAESVQVAGESGTGDEDPSGLTVPESEG